MTTIMAIKQAIYAWVMLEPFITIATSNALNVYTDTEKKRVVHETICINQMLLFKMKIWY